MFILTQGSHQENVSQNEKKTYFTRQQNKDNVLDKISQQEKVGLGFTDNFTILLQETEPTLYYISKAAQCSIKQCIQQFF